MSQRHDVEKHLDSLLEISEIMGSMKSLAVMEMHKLSRGQDNVQRVDKTIAEIADDFRAFYLAPDYFKGNAALYILLGSERGFCGDFNASIVEHCEVLLTEEQECFCIAIGQKLYSGMEGDQRLLANVSGASTMEEIGRVMEQLLVQINRIQEQHGLLSIKVLHHTQDEEITLLNVFPPFNEAPKPSPFANRPVINLNPQLFYGSLMMHYLYARLSSLLYSSLLTENQRRVQHLEGTLRRIDEQVDELTKKRNVLRQGEITEEIEVILLSAGEF